VVLPKGSVGDLTAGVTVRQPSGRSRLVDVLRAHSVAHSVGHGEGSGRAAANPCTTDPRRPTKVCTVRLSRRQLLQASAVTGAAAVAAPGLFGFAPAVRARGPRPFAIDPPESGFELTGDWTTHADELSFLDEVVTGAVNPITIDKIGETAQGRPLHQLVLGAGATPNGLPRTMPTVMVLGSQHGNEPAGREASLKLLRDLAFADLTAPENADLARLLADQTIIVVPSANPDGRAANTRHNGVPHVDADGRQQAGFDINRDHLALRTEEARAFADVILEWEPFMALDLHEYGPSAPVVYDDDLLYLWPRNLNVDEAVRTMARTYCEQYIKVDGEAAGYTADEYGLYKVGPNIGPVQTGFNDNNAALQQAGGPDEGICRNAMGLRHTLGILVESATTQSPHRPMEVVDAAESRRRRVASQRVVLDSMLRFQTEQGAAAKDVCDGSRARKAREGAEQSAPVYFAGQDDDRPLQASTVEAVDAPRGYQLSAEDQARLADTSQGIGRAVSGQGISVSDSGFVTMAQHAEPLIPLLLDARGSRSITSAQPVD